MKQSPELTLSFEKRKNVRIPHFLLSFSFLALFFCYAVSSCVYDHNHPYLVSDREQGFSVPAESSGAPAESLAIL